MGKREMKTTGTHEGNDGSWKRAWSATHSAWYYISPTGHKSYELRTPHLPRGWKMKWSTTAKAGYAYYTNQLTRQSQWTMPTHALDDPKGRPYKPSAPAYSAPRYPPPLVHSSRPPPRVRFAE